MPSLKKLFVDAVGALICDSLRVERTQQLGRCFHRLTLSGARELRWTPGDKLQVMLDDGPRTYTPFAHDLEHGTIDLLVFAHGDSPGARWGKTARVGDPVRVFGPRASLALPSFDAPIRLFGDETSFALAVALRALGRESQLLFEVTDVGEANEVLAALGLDATVHERDGATQAQRDEWFAASTSETSLLLTGKAQSIQAVRQLLRARNVPHAKQKSKAYWAPGKRGLD